MYTFSGSIAMNVTSQRCLGFKSRLRIPITLYFFRSILIWRKKCKWYPFIDHKPPPSLLSCVSFPPTQSNRLFTSWLFLEFRNGREPGEEETEDGARSSQKKENKLKKNFFYRKEEVKREGKGRWEWQDEWFKQTWSWGMESKLH